jgi:hypothetical protein
MKNNVSNFIKLLSISLLIISCSPQKNDSIVVEAIPDGASITEYAFAPELTHATINKGNRVTLEGDLLDENRHGAWISYDENGSIKSIDNYYKGVKHGAFIVFDSQGYISSVTNYANGILHGGSYLYSRNKISEEKNYVNGDLEGLVKKYYPSGKIMQEAPYKNGKIHGIARWYNEEGNSSLVYEYKNGELIDKNPQLD